MKEIEKKVLIELGVIELKGKALKEYEKQQEKRLQESFDSRIERLVEEHSLDAEKWYDNNKGDYVGLMKKTDRQLVSLIKKFNK